MTDSAEKDARGAFGKCSECPKVVRLTAKGKSSRHKRLAGAREFGGPRWCEGSGIAPARVFPSAEPDDNTAAPVKPRTQQGGSEGDE